VPRVRQLEVLGALTLAATVAFILITPDCTDDVDAILHLVKATNSRALEHVLALDIVPVVRVRGPLHGRASLNVTLHVPEQLCTYRC
jgi:hypothetical protein